jgi:hypothetical protein
VFLQQQHGERTEWTVDGRLVASAAVIDGYWQIVDRRGQRVVTLMPASDQGDVALIGADGPLGTVTLAPDGGDDLLRDATGRALLVRRSDGATGRVVDVNGEVVAVASVGEQGATKDILITSRGIAQPLSLLFGLLLAAESARAPGDRLA